MQIRWHILVYITVAEYSEKHWINLPYFIDLFLLIQPQILNQPFSTSPLELGQAFSCEK